MKVTNVCGAHDNIGTAFFDSAVEAVRAAVPEGGTVYAIGFEDTGAFLRAGYRIDRDADVVIARGGEEEFLEGRRTPARSAGLILCPTRAYPASACGAYRAEDGPFALIGRGAPPFATVIDSSDIADLADAFGEIAALDLCGFELNFAKRMRGEATVDMSGLTEQITELTSGLAPHCKDRKKASELIAAAGRAVAARVAQEPELLHFSGAAQAAEAVRMLYTAEGRTRPPRGEAELQLAVAVTDLYIKNIDGSALDFPPDNNRRIDSLCEYLKTDVRRACVYTSAIYPPFKMRLCEYRRDEFRLELMRELVDLRRRLAAAIKVFKRLRPDDGFAMSAGLDRTDLPLCIALAPDVFSADTMLSFLKQTGRLERYII